MYAQLNIFPLRRPIISSITDLFVEINPTNSAIVIHALKKEIFLTNRQLTTTIKFVLFVFACNSTSFQGVAIFLIEKGASLGPAVDCIH